MSDVKGQSGYRGIPGPLEVLRGDALGLDDLPDEAADAVERRGSGGDGGGGGAGDAGSGGGSGRGGILEWTKAGWGALSMSISDLGGGGEVWLFGRNYGEYAGTPIAGEREHPFRSAFRTIFWSTYRKNFLAIQDTAIKSDAGWGCMIRSGQMVLAQALKCALLGRDTRASDAQWHKTLQTIAHWFVDSPGTRHVYSIHAIVEAGKSVGIAPGEWYGPNTVAQVLRDLSDKHCRDGDGCLRVCVFNSRVLFVDQLNELMTSSSASSSGPDALHARSRSSSTGRRRSSGSAAGGPDVPAWLSQACILIPLKLGPAKHIDPTYIPALLEVMKLEHCIGCIGGTPRHSLYFVGTRGVELVYLDPHHTQECPSTKLHEADLNSFQNADPRFMRASSIDPSLAVAFFCRNYADFCDLRARLSSISDEVGQGLFDIEDITPGYEAGALDAMADSVTFLAGAGGEGAAAEGDDDEWELL